MEFKQWTVYTNRIHISVRHDSKGFFTMQLATSNLNSMKPPTVNQSQETNKDLVWNLDAIKQRSKATRFIMQFRNTLCVHSGSVEQLYTNYDLYVPEDQNKKIVILPNPHAFHDTFQGVPAESVVKTGMNIIPGELVGKAGLYLTIPTRSKSVKAVPLNMGLGAIVKRQKQTNDPFLPVLAKGDLREFKHSIPCLHLHRVVVSRLTNRSALERSGITGAISAKLDIFIEQGL